MNKNLRILFPNLGILVMLLQKACEEFAQCMKFWGTTLNMRNLATLPKEAFGEFAQWMKNKKLL
jgi:ubiquinone biosynthesis protein Coq4